MLKLAVEIDNSYRKEANWGLHEQTAKYVAVTKRIS
jgi:hypothetical protein